MTLSEFVSNPNLVEQAAALQNSEIYKLMIGVCETEHPGKEFLPLTTPIEQRGVLQSKAQGFQEALTKLRLCGKKVAIKPKHLETTYGVKPIEEPKKE